MSFAYQIGLTAAITVLATLVTNVPSIIKRIRYGIAHQIPIEYWPEPVLTEFQNQLALGHTINAIKIYKEMTGVRLMDAKDAVKRSAATRK